MGGTEIIFIFLIYLILFGAKGIPSLARTMGKAVRQFRDATGDIQREMMKTADDIKHEARKVEGQVQKSLDPSEPEKPKKAPQPESRDSSPKTESTEENKKSEE
ncbi:MAG: twin-arginine translocase TatA/TatE family subunit [Flavobacteriales bacterium]|nr:twin-arginine translocase TatA/TatE family subunit [Flavobacteriales bacterium]